MSSRSFPWLLKPDPVTQYACEGSLQKPADVDISS